MEKNWHLYRAEKVFVSDAKGKFINEIATSPQERVLEVHWLKDNKTLIYGQTYKGFENFYTQNAEGNEPQKQITNLQKTAAALLSTVIKTKAVYLCGSDEVRLLDLKTMQSSQMVKDEIWGLEIQLLIFLLMINM